MEPKLNTDNRRESARDLGLRLTRDVAALGPVEVSPAASAAGAAFLIELSRWEYTPGRSASAKLLAAYVRVLEAWQAAAEVEAKRYPGTDPAGGHP
jgi:hypothetical protein